MKQISAFRITIISLFAALVCVATMLVRIPIPATGGYANLGDGIILTCAFLMPPGYAAAAAGLGSVLADLLAGYAGYAPATLLVKAGVALLAALVLRSLDRRKSAGANFLAMIVAGIIAEAFMVLGYFLYEALIMGLGAGAAAGIIGNIGQGVTGVIAACVIAPVLRKSPEISAMMRRM